MPLVDDFLAGLAAALDADGDMPIIHAHAETDGGERIVAALAVPPGQAWAFVLERLIADRTVREVAFGIDRFSRPGQGVETPSLVTVYHWRRDRREDGGWRFGVVPYDKAGCRPVAWDHPHWTPIQRAEAERTLDAVKAGLEATLARFGLGHVPPAVFLAELRKLGPNPGGAAIQALRGRLAAWDATGGRA